ncbi:MAG: chromosomal replication initiator protein DnaA [Eubacterium sp.]|jgi:chromosomal replication initiator protein|nr:chromosomal replication initiator protein DnaA [Eubacterium sp.]
MEAIYEKWELILQEVKEEHDISQISFDTWLKPLELCAIKDATLYILVPQGQMALNLISKKYELPLKVAITEMTGVEYHLVFVLPEQANQLRSASSKKNQISSQAAERANLNISYTFETFVVGNNNRFAQSACLAVAESPGEAYNPLYIYGGPGLGKTHLMHSIGNFILEQNPDSRVLYVTSEEFTNEVIESIRTGNATAMTKLREKYRTVDVLMIDDVQFIIGKESTQEEFFHTFNVLHSAGKQIILTSDKPPKEMETLEERIQSRFEWGLMADIGLPDYETRMAILRRKVEMDEMELSDEILNYIANNIKSNIRELEGALNKLLAYGNLVKTEITMDIAMKELQNIITPDKPKEITPQLIIEVVSEHFQISMNQIISKARNSDIVRPRHIAMYLCKNMTDATMESIGVLLGNRDHTTVMNGVKKITKEYDNNENTRILIETIKKKINPN